MDGAGNVYTSGYTVSSDFPTSPGAFDPSINGDYDVFVAKLNPAGDALVYATFLGGAYQDHGLHIAVDAAGQAVVTGYTESSDFPTTPGAFDTSHNGSDRDWDAFVVKLNPAGSGLSYGTFLGGGRGDIAYSVALDGAGSAYVTGGTASTNFPSTPGAFQSSCYGPYCSDAFVVKLNSSGSGLDYATFLGGAWSESGSDISLDSAGNAYVTGGTGSNNFPTTPGAFDTNLGGYTDAFVVKLNSVGSGLDYATFLGGGAQDQGSSIAVDGAGNAYVIGATDSADFPVTAGAFDTSHNGVSDVFVVKLNPAGAGLAYATFLGGSNADLGAALALDGTGSVYLTGSTSSADFPAHSTAFDPIYNGGSRDAFVARLSPTGAGLVYGTFLGGTDWDEGHGVAVDGNDDACVTGYTYSGSLYFGSFPTTPASFDPTHNGNADAFVVKMNLSQAATPTATPTATATATPTPTPTPTPSQIWYVKPGGNDANDCRSPQTACATLQGPLSKGSFMPGDTIRAAVGVYTGAEGAVAAVSVSKDATFSGGWDAATFAVRQGKSELNGLGQIGLGFQIAEGVEAAIEHFELRDFNTAGVTLHETGSISVSNCTLRSNGTGIDAFGETHVRVGDSVISDNRGLGIFVGHYYSEPGGSLLVENSTIARNLAGGINSSGTTTITYSLIAQNVSNAHGAGAWVNGTSLILDNLILDNTSQDDGGGLAILGYDEGAARIHVARNVIRGNLAESGGGMYIGLNSGPAVTTIVESNRIIDNATSDDWCGGGILIDGRGAIVRNNIITSNTAEYGGGICTYGSSNQGQNWIVNNTIVDNGGDGIIITNPFDTVVRLVNNIIAGNSNRGIVGWGSSNPDAQTVEYNLVWGNSNGDYVDIPNMTGFNGNISQPPLLVNRFGGPWYLGAGSPAIDAGTNQHAPPFDIEGDPRPYNTQVDMGADEWTGDRTYPTRYLPIIMRR
jgi:hypothetical protein